jgi:succinate dehydrogenase/fumarate reductase cytochrome b subunit
MNSAKVRTIHRRLGISIAFFLFVQAMAGMLMGAGRLAAIDSSPFYTILYSIHADWDPWGSMYRVILGIATAMQGVLGIKLFLSRKKKTDTSSPSPDQPVALKKEGSVHVLSFAADISPLFRSYDIESMKPFGIDLSSYEDVKKHARDIYARLSAKEMPCDGPWSESHLQKFKEWIESSMEE